MAKNKEAEDGKVVSILCYLLIGIIWYFVDEKMKKNKFANFHCKQGLALLIVCIIINIVGGIIPVLGWFIILPIGSLLCLIWAILGIINAANGNQNALFLIGGIGKKFSF